MKLKIMEKMHGNIWLVLLHGGETEIFSLYRSFYDAKKLISIPDEPLPIFVINLAQCFQNCSSLTEIPNYAKQLFERVDNFKNINKLTSVSYLFNNCINIIKIDDSIYLPYTINDYSGLFFNCNKLKNIPETFWPTTYETDKINVSNICNGCINLTSNIPGYKLWGNLNILWNSKEAFKNCINISNYSEIPDLWK